MEAAGQIDPGSMHRLRKDAKQEKFAGFKQLQMLAQALSPCVSMDAFLPKCLPPETSSENTLCQLPVLVCTADEERKQTLCWNHFALDQNHFALDQTLQNGKC